MSEDEKAEEKAREISYYARLFSKGVADVRTNGITREKTITFSDGSPEVKIPFMPYRDV
jgi:hypothetical protein